MMFNKTFLQIMKDMLLYGATRQVFETGEKDRSSPCDESQRTASLVSSLPVFLITKPDCAK